MSTITTVAAWLSRANAIVSFSGAGLSKASGIPTYRDAGGLWTTGNNLRFSSAESIRDDQDGFVEFWGARIAEVTRVEPNAGHLALAELGRQRPDVQHITQNIDGLLARAGCAPVHELHGSIARWRCDNCGTGPFSPQVRCPSCEQLARPDVTLFGEALDHRTLAIAEYVAKRSEVCLVIGTTALVQPAANVVHKAQVRGSKIVVINVEASVLDSDADAVLRGPAQQVLQELVAALA
jgi:NAD-dependent deacetylase